MHEPSWEYECIGPWTFRVAPQRIGNGWMSEAKRGPFVARDIFHEPGQCWFEFGKTKHEALSKLKAEVLPLTFAPVVSIPPCFHARVNAAQGGLSEKPGQLP